MVVPFDAGRPARKARAARTFALLKDKIWRGRFGVGGIWNHWCLDKALFLTQYPIASRPSMLINGYALVVL
jgi:hypothetical protein